MADLGREKKRKLKEMITQLHAGASPEEVKTRFKQVLESTSPEEIAKIEQELVQEGMPREELQSLCDVHLAVFKEQLEKQKPATLPSENALNILSSEHEILQQRLEQLSQIVNRVQQENESSNVSEDIEQLKRIAEDFLDAEKHYLREENVLFPLLEKHGVSEPPAIMWSEHNKIREKKRQFHKLMENYNALSLQDFKAQLVENSRAINTLLGSHLFKENNILFPTAQRIITDEEWRDARRQFDEIGYCRFTPPHLITRPQAEVVEKPKPEAAVVPEGLLKFETGTIPSEGVEAILNTFPFDITFVDAQDTVRYFNKARERIFVRTPAVIGRKVQLCHPQQSVDLVNKILNSFKSGQNNVTEFWINKDDKLVHIRYFAVRDGNGKYLGTLEVAQDITDIKKIEGEKRLLDWKD